MKVTKEVKVGIFVFLCIIGFLYLVVSTGRFNFSDKGYTVYVSFDDVLGLAKSAPVMFNGLEIGMVEDTDVSYNGSQAKIVLKLKIDEKIKIPNNSKITIKTLGFMGEKYVHISSGSSPELASSGTMLEGTTPSDMDKILVEAEHLATQVTEVAKAAESLAVNINKTVSENREILNTLLANSSEVTGRVNLTLKENEDSLNLLLSSLGNAAKNFEEFSADLKLHPWKLLVKTKSNKIDN